MSQENVAVARRAYDAFERDGLDGLLRYLHPEIEWTTTGTFIEAGTYRGHEEVRRYLGSMLDEFEDSRNEPQELIDAGDQVVVSARLTGRGKRSGAPVELTLTSVAAVRDGMFVRVRNYSTKAEALEAVGLSEQAMSRE
jgi:ketosteroid isomerase-like protein